MFKKRKKKEKIIKRKDVKIKKRRSSVKSRKKSNIMLIILIWALYLLTVFYVMFYTNLLLIEDVQISAATEIEEEQIKAIFKKEISGKNLFYIKKENLLVVNKDDLKNKIINLPTIKEVTVKKKFPNKLKIKVINYDTLIVMCEYEKKTGNCSVVDIETGKIHQENVDLTSDFITKNDVLYIILQNELSFEEVIITPKILEQVMYFYKNITYNIDTTISNEYHAKTIGMHNFYLLTNDGWELRVDFTQNMEEVLLRLRQIFNHTDIGKDRNDLLFIDTRYGEKLVYKLKSFESEKKGNLES